MSLSRPPSVLLVARDIAPSNAFALLAPELGNCGWDVMSALGKGKEISREVFDAAYAAVPSADVVVLGMSAPSTNAAEELAIANWAIESGKRIVLYADTFRAWTRDWFENIRPHVALLFVVSQDEVAVAQTYFPNAQVIVTGNPSWENFTPLDPLARSVARGVCGVPVDRGWLIASPGGKDQALNLIAWRALRTQVKVMPDLWVIMTRHPGDRVEQAEYERMLSTNERFGFAPVGVTSAQLVNAADLLVEPNPTSLALQAAMGTRIPVLTVMSPAGYLRLSEVFGTEVWPLWPLCVGARTDEHALCGDIEAMLVGYGRGAMITQQHQVFPSIPPSGTAISLMVEALKAL